MNTAGISAVPGPPHRAHRAAPVKPVGPPVKPVGSGTMATAASAGPPTSSPAVGGQPGAAQPPHRTAVRIARPRVSVVVHRRGLAVGIVLVMLTLVGLCVALSLGSLAVGPIQVAEAVAGHGSRATVFVVQELRLPRALTALAIGAAFAASGALFQTVTRNPLASPDIIGITEGASTAVVAGIALGIGAGIGRPATALIGGLTSAALIYLLAWKRGTTGYRIVLIGIAISAMCAAITDYLLISAQLYQVQEALVWLVGDLNATRWEDLRQLLPLAVLLPAAVAVSGRLRSLELGDDVAAVLGVRVQLSRLAVVGVGVGLVALATAVAGPVAFVALIAPQVAARLARLSHPPVILAVLTGALLTLAADAAAQHLIPGRQLPVGVITGVIGAPYLLWLLIRTNRRGAGA